MDSLLSDCAEIEVVIDDTLNNCVGKKIFGAGLQHNGNAPKTGKPIGYGVCFVITGGLLFVYQDIGQSVLSALCGSLLVARKGQDQAKERRLQDQV